MVDKVLLKKEIARIKDMLRKVKGFDDFSLLHTSLEVIYLRISNRKDKDYSDTYDAMRIFKGKTLKTVKKVKGKNGVIFEFIEYEGIPSGFVVIYNEFKNGLQIEIDIYDPIKPTEN